MARRRRGRPVSGWILLDKPPGMTSTHAVACVRSQLKAAKAGHAGTLDPLATGVLPIALGEATKLVGRIMEGKKHYRFLVRWGEERDTDDAEGEVIARSDARPTREEIERCLPDFMGEIAQQPPTYSAIKVEGERAYDLAREGRAAELPPRPVTVYELRLLAMPDADHAEFEMVCGKGAYVRSLARDLGRVLGCRAHVARLRRVRVGPMAEAQAIPLDNLRALGHKGALEQALLPVETALDDIPALAVTGAEAARLKNGQTVRVPSTRYGMVRVTSEGWLVALGDLADGELKPVRVFHLKPDVQGVLDVDNG